MTEKSNYITKKYSNNLNINTMTKKVLLIILCALPLCASAQTVQVLDSIVSYIDGNNGIKYEYQYDQQGIAISETYSYWDSSTNIWTKDRKCEYQYDANNNQTWLTFYWNSSVNMWVGNRKYEYLYIDNNNQTWVTFYWDSSINMWVQSKKYEYQYNGNNKQTLETYYFWDNGTNAWTQISTAQYNYYYSPLTVNGIFQVNKEQSATVFPNPAMNYITIKGTTESIITVSTLSGVIIYKQVMTDESKTIDVSLWSSGTYLISVEKGTNRTVSKIIKK